MKIAMCVLAPLPTGSLMVGVVLLSRRMKVNPDNVATPIAASLGDLITLALLAGVSSVLYSAIGESALRCLSPGGLDHASVAGRYQLSLVLCHW